MTRCYRKFGNNRHGCTQTPTENEQTALSLATDYLEYLELTRYPQRLILEQLLIDEQ